MDQAHAQDAAEPRFGASVAWDSARNRAVLFGGFDETTGRLNDTWEWDGQRPGPSGRLSGTKPTPASQRAMVYDSARGKIVLFSGNAGSRASTAGTWVHETWEWDGAAGTWTLITAPVVTATQYN